MSVSLLSEQFVTLSADLDDLATLLRAIPPLQAYVAAIPPVSKGMEQAPITKIGVAALRGSAASSLAARGYKDLHIDPLYSTKSARRFVGVIWFSPVLTPSAKHIPGLIQRINTAKANIEDTVVANWETRKERFEALRAAIPGIMTLHLYRQIRCFSDAELTSVRFSWQRKDVVVKANKAALVADIALELERAGSDYQLRLKQLLEKVSGASESALRIRRDVKVQPAANIMASGELKTVTAPLPLIIVQEELVKLKMLGDFDASIQRTTRSDKVLSEKLGSFRGVSIEAFPE